MSIPSQSGNPEESHCLPPDPVLFGKSEVMRDIQLKLARVCTMSVPVLLEGEVGVGKGVLSRYIHCHSPWVHGPYVRVNCAAMVEPTACLDLFAVPKAGCIGPVSDESGGISPSAWGTVYLNEICELRPRLQRQLSHVLAETESYSGREPRQELDRKRIICSSTRNLRRELKLGHFLRELFDRLVVVTIDIPPLRSRMKDLPEITAYLRHLYATQLGVADKPFSPDLLARVQNYRWPGNIRELESFVCRCVLLGPDQCATELSGSPGEDAVGLEASERDHRSFGRKMRSRWKT